MPSHPDRVRRNYSDALAHLDGITRLEVIDETGRRYTRWDCSVDVSWQDNGRILKLFVSLGENVASPTGNNDHEDDGA